jgi:hypothetical protein
MEKALKETLENFGIEEILETGDIKELTDEILGFVQVKEAAGALTEDHCHAIMSLLSHLGDREGITKEESAYLRRTHNNLMHNGTLFLTTACIHYIIRSFLSGCISEDAFGGALCVLKREGLSHKNIKQSVNKYLSVKSRKEFGHLLRKIEPLVDEYIQLEKATDKLAEAFNDVENDPWTEEKALTEAVEGMSWATQMLLREGHLDSAAYLTKKGVVIVYPLLFNTEIEKNRSIKGLQMIVNKVKPDAVTTLAEIWMSSAPDNIRPSQDPNRKEGILVSVETPLGIWHGFQHFARGENDKIVLGELVAPEKTEAEGRFVFMDHKKREVQCDA